LGWGDYDLRLNMFTGEPNGPRRFDDPDNYPEGYHTGDADQFRLGAISFGKGNRRIGWNSEWIRNKAQNEFAHGVVRRQPYFKRWAGGYPGRLFWQTSTFDNPYSLWSF
jgi:hypothetical protein